MTGSLLQLVAKGMQDVYLIGDPQITLFIAVYRRTSNFSMYDHTFDLKGCDFSKEFKLQFDYLGDLLHKLWLVVDIPEVMLERTKATFNYVYSLLASYGILWNYSPESQTSIVTLNNYNGGTANLTSNKINTTIFYEGNTILNLTTGQLNVGQTKVKIISGTLILDTQIMAPFNSEFGPFQTILSVPVIIMSGTIKISTNSIFGDVFPISNGTITLNKQKVGSNYVYFISDVQLNSEFTLTIMDSINSKITSLIETYNFYNTAQIITRNSDTIINNSVKIFDNVISPSSTLTDSTVIIKHSLISGRNTFMQIIQTILSKYAANYSQDTETYFFPRLNDNYVIQDSTNYSSTRSAQLYSTELKNTMIPYGLLLGAIQNYSYDTNVYNANYEYKHILVIGNDAGIGKLYMDMFGNTTVTDISNTVLSSIWISGKSVNNIIQTISDKSGNIYTSIDSGESWSSTNISTFELGKIVGSGDGSTQMCISNNTGTGHIYISTDGWSSYVDTTIPLTGTNTIAAIIIVEDGTNATIVTTDGVVYTYDGNIWTQQAQLSITQIIVDMCSSSDGSVQVIVESNGKVFMSNDFWASNTYSTIDLVGTNNVVTSIYMSPDGTRETVSDFYGNVYLSATNTAANTTINTTWSTAHNVCSNPLVCVSMGTTDGKQQIAVDSAGNLYISYHYGIKWSSAKSTNMTNTNGAVGCAIRQVKIQDSVRINLDNFDSVPLFEDTLIRPNSDITNIIKFKLYNSDDMRMFFYTTFVNNILRQKIVLTSNEEIPFNPLYTTTLKTIDIQISALNLEVLDPDNTFLDDTLLFYHIIDPRITNYAVYPYDYESNTDTYFDNNIETNYTLYDKYNTLVNGTREVYTKTDSYKVYKSFIKDVMSSDIVNKTIKSKQQVNLLATTLRYNADLNVRYNFSQVLNNITILINATRTNSKHLIITFYRQYIASSNTFVPTSTLSFNPIINSNSFSLADNFKSLLDTVIQIPVPDGVVITNYFNNYIDTQTKNFIISCQNLLKATNYSDYTDNYSLWSRIAVTSGSSILGAYNTVNLVYTDYPSIPGTIFGKIASMNFIPLLAAKDIPVMLYDTFNQYGKQIMIDIGVDTETSHTNYDAFLELIDFRDRDLFDRPKPLPTSIPANVVETKLEIYNRIILGTVLIPAPDNTVGTSHIVDNAAYFSQLQSEKASGQLQVLSCSLRPESYFCPYSTENQDGSLTDSSTDPLDINNLPIEWLTQTYYNIFKNRINNFVDGLISTTTSTTSTIPDQNKIAKKLLVGIMGNVINCFILRNDMPLYSNYKNNNFSLLGLAPETNSAINKYKKSKEQITVYDPQYTDAISSIWYQTQKGMIQLYNSLYNDTLISSKYYYENLGNTMGSIFDYIKEQIIDEDNPYYYANGNDYPESLPQSLLDSFVDIHKSTFSSVPLSNIDDPTVEVVQQILNYVGEIYPAVDTKSTSAVSTNAGFNFFKLNIGDPTVSTSKAYKINAYIKDYSLLYRHLIDYYETHKNITLIKNDIDTLNYTFNNTTKLKRKNTFQYEQASVLTNYISEHIVLTYISPIIDKKVREDLLKLVESTANYWNPDVVSGNVYIRKNPNGIYGILDAIYNTHFDGSISDTLSKTSIIPAGKTSNDLIDFTQNPFTSYCLRQWYASLNDLSGRFTYGDLINVTNLLNSKLYNINDPLITTQSILKNKFTAKLYSDIEKSSFSCVEYVAWFLFDLVMSDSTLNSFIKFEPLLQTIQKTTSVKFNPNLFSNQTTVVSTIDGADNGAIETLQQLLVNYILPNSSATISQFEKISKFKITANTATYNNLNQYYDMTKVGFNNDINYYQQSLDGTPIINVQLEARLFNLISGIKPKYAWAKELGHKIFKRLSISIGGQTIDTHTPELAHLVYNLTGSYSHKRGYDILIGNTEEMYTYSSKSRTSTKLMIPCNFWFCKNAGSSLPLINLLYTDIVLSGQISNLNELLYIEPDTMFKKPVKLKYGVMCRYIYLDDDERTNIANSKMEYLIEKFNYNGHKTFSQSNLFSAGANLATNTINTVNLENLSATAIVDIHINDPIKYFVWYIKFRDKTTEQPIDILNWCNFGYNVRDSELAQTFIKTTIESIELKMNGVSREMGHPESHYTHLIPFDKLMGSLESGEYVYSFALYPLLLQPTGSANYSEIPNSYFVITFTKQIEDLFKANPNLEVKIEVWGQAYNTFRCISGMGGLVFFKP